MPCIYSALGIPKLQRKLVMHTILEVWLPQTKWTLNATYLGSSGTYLGFISYLLENKKTSLFWVGSQHVQPIQPKFGGFFCLCTTGPQKRLFFFYFTICTRWSLNGSRMTPGGWRFMFFFFAESYFPMKCVLGL